MRLNHFSDLSNRQDSLHLVIQPVTPFMDQTTFWGGLNKVHGTVQDLIYPFFRFLTHKGIVGSTAPALTMRPHHFNQVQPNALDRQGCQDPDVLPSCIGLALEVPPMVQEALPTPRHAPIYSASAAWYSSIPGTGD
jgi:hypothetical protein